jgi:hypothetical protein
MPVRYIEVTATSELFVPAVRAFGDIAIVGRGGFGTPASPPQAFTDPAHAVTAYPPGATKLEADAAKDATTISTTDSIPASTVVQIDTADNSETRTVDKVSGTGPFKLTLSAPLALPHGNGTAVRQPSTDLAAAIAIAFRQSPPPTRIWGIQVAAANPDWDTALTAVANLNVQIVVLANVPLNAANAAVVNKLATQVADVSNTGGDGKERIGVAMLDPALAAANAAALNTGAVHHERMFLVAHKSKDDVAAATAGVIAGYEPHISLLLKPINIDMVETFSDTDIDEFDEHSINWVTSPTLIPGHGLFLGEGYTANPGEKKKYIDIVRTIDDVKFRIKAALIQAIGDLRFSRSGLRAVVTLVQSVLATLVTQAVIEDYTIHIPLLVLLDKDPVSLSDTENQQIQTARASRAVDMVVAVVYAGAIHRLHIDLVFK